MKSMTGFGRSEARSASGSLFQVEIVSVNRKQLEIKPFLPKEAVGLEPLVRKFISSRITRGCVTVKIAIVFSENLLQETIQINDSIIDGYIRRIVKFQERYELPMNIDVAGVMSLPGAVTAQANPALIDDDISTFDNALAAAFDKFDEMRAAEGRQLKKDIARRLAHLEKHLSKIEPLSTGVPERHRELFLKRLADSGLEVKGDDERIVKEIAVFCDKFDITEEITRLKSHFLQFKKFLQKSESSGRSLDFLIQEMMREINTLGNKTPLIEVTFIIVDFKTELEKIREQVQNIE